MQLTKIQWDEYIARCKEGIVPWVQTIFQARISFLNI